MGEVTAFGNAMLVGKPLKILVAYSTAIIECQCEAKAILVLPGKNRVVHCPACQKAFAIANSGQIDVGEVVGMRPEGSV
jgi:hypothetical protein